MGSSQHFWFTTFLPRIAFVSICPGMATANSRSGAFGLIGSFCPQLAANIRRVTSEEVDGRLGQLITNMLYMFHVHVIDQQTGSRFAVGPEILEAVRAIRDVSAPSALLQIGSELTHSACMCRRAPYRGRTSIRSPPRGRSL